MLQDERKAEERKTGRKRQRDDFDDDEKDEKSALRFEGGGACLRQEIWPGCAFDMLMHGSYRVSCSAWRVRNLESTAAL